MAVVVPELKPRPSAVAEADDVEVVGPQPQGDGVFGGAQLQIQPSSWVVLLLSEPHGVLHNVRPALVSEPHAQVIDELSEVLCVGRRRDVESHRIIIGHPGLPTSW
jgi:hypothetical protein